MTDKRTTKKQNISSAPAPAGTPDTSAPAPAGAGAPGNEPAPAGAPAPDTSAPAGAPAPAGNEPAPAPAGARLALEVLVSSEAQNTNDGIRMSGSILYTSFMRAGYSDNYTINRASQIERHLALHLVSRQDDEVRVVRVYEIEPAPAPAPAGAPAPDTSAPAGNEPAPAGAGAPAGDTSPAGETFILKGIAVRAPGALEGAKQGTDYHYDLYKVLPSAKIACSPEGIRISGNPEVVSDDEDAARKAKGKSTETPAGTSYLTSINPCGVLRKGKNEAGESLPMGINSRNDPPVIYGALCSALGYTVPETKRAISEVSTSQKKRLSEMETGMLEMAKVLRSLGKESEATSLLVKFGLSWGDDTSAPAPDAAA